MKKIREKLIKWLGGVTQEEHKKLLEYHYLEGKVWAFESILEEMRFIYGTSAEKWCEYMYKCVEYTYGHYHDLYEDCKKRIRQ